MQASTDRLGETKLAVCRARLNRTSRRRCFGRTDRCAEPLIARALHGNPVVERISGHRSSRPRRIAPMTKPDPEFGSSAWAEQVFSTPPVRSPGGRSRRTHRHGPFANEFGYDQVVEGRTEVISFLTLEYMHTLGLVGRCKPQPYYYRLPTGGDERTPDFLFELINPTRIGLYAAEAKAAGRITREIEREQERAAIHHEAHGVQYLLWTDKAPMTLAFKHNVLGMRRSSREDVSMTEAINLLDYLGPSGSRSVRELYEQGFDQTLIEFLAWRGDVFFPLMEALDDKTRVTRQRNVDFVRRLLGGRPDSQAWWNSLPHC